jgi:hypothetical protein
VNFGSTYLNVLKGIISPVLQPGFVT